MEEEAEEEIEEETNFDDDDDDDDDDTSMFAIRGEMIWIAESVCVYVSVTISGGDGNAAGLSHCPIWKAAW